MSAIAARPILRQPNAEPADAETRGVAEEPAAHRMPGDGDVGTQERVQAGRGDDDRADQHHVGDLRERCRRHLIVVAGQWQNPAVELQLRTLGL